MSEINKNDILSGLFTPTAEMMPLDLKKAQSIVTENKGIENVQMLPLDQIDDLSSFSHPFEKSLKDAASIENLAFQIYEAGGIVQPIIVRKKEDGRYETLAGHRRRRAAKLIGFESIPAIVRDLNDEAAKFVVIDNLGQREKTFPSEIAKAYKLTTEERKRNEKNKGKKTVELLAETAGIGVKQVQRYIRLNELILPLMDLVDEDKIPVYIGAEISYLKKEEQTALAELFQYEILSKITADEAKTLKDISLSQSEIMSRQDIEKILIPEEKEKMQAEQKARPPYKLAFRSAEKYIKKLPGEKAERLALFTQEQIEQAITEALERLIS